MNNFLTKENITFALSIFGSIGTLFTFTYTYWTKRRNLKVTIASAIYKTHLHQLILIVNFENRSQLPISVISTNLLFNKQLLKPLRYPKWVGYHKYSDGPEVVDRVFKYNLELPLNIDYLSALSGHILFDISEEDLQNLSTPATLQLRVSRGSALKISLKPNQIKWIENEHTL